MPKLSVPLRILANHRFGLGLLAGTIALLWAGIWLHLSVMHRHTDEAAERDAANLARSLEQNIVRTVEAADQVLRFIQVSHARDPARFNLFDWAAAYRPADGLAVQIVIVGADGRLRASSLEPQVSTIDVSDRSYFNAHLNTDEDRLFISEPLLGRVSRRWTVQVTRPLRDADGRFQGVVLLSLDTAYLARFYDSLRSGRSSVTLAGTDGVIRARAPAQEGTLGATLPPRALRLIANGVGGNLRVDGAFDGVRRLYSLRVVPSYPLAVIVGLDLDQAFAAFRADLWRSVAAGAVATLMLVLTGMLLLRQSEHLTRSRRALRITLDRMTLGVVMAGPDGKVQVLNRRARELLRLPQPLDRPGAPMAEVLVRLGPGPDAAALTSQERLRADGTAIETQILPLPDGGTLLTCADVTAQHTMAAAQAEARAAAEAASRAKSDFLANMSHEIRTPMNGVVGMVQVLRHSGLTDKQREMCEIITRSANALLTVLNDILDYSKLEAGKIVLEPLPCRVQELVSDVAQLLRGAAGAKGIGLQVILRAEPPPVLIDPTRLRQVLVNLLSNAVKFSENGEITITLDSEPDPEAEGHARLRIAVRDQGIGITPEALANLFTRFTQADASSTRRFGGSGLGLSISRELTRMMGGDISVWSQADEGSEFTIRLSLPIVELPATTDEDTAEIPLGPKRDLSILVAEDDEINRVVIANFLQPDGHKVSFAFNGVDAVLAVRRQSFDLILMDVMMPGMDGPTATTRIRGMDGPSARIPIIALTANAMSGDRERYMAAGMNGYVSKPINRRELHRTIERLLGVHAFARGTAAPAATALPAPVVTAEVIEEVDDILAGLQG